MSSPMDNTTEFLSNSDTNENHLTSSDEKSSTEKGKEISRNFVEDPTEKENESNGDASVDEFEVISKPDCQAKVASAKGLDNYTSQLPEEPDIPNNSTEEVYEDTPCCHHTKEQSSSSARKLKDKTLSGPQKLVPEKMIADSNEECSETSDKTKWYSYFRFEVALNCIKNFILCISFTGSLVVAMTLGKVFGIDFPVGKSKRNNKRENSLQEYPTL